MSGHAKTVYWEIGKGDQSLTLSPSSVTVAAGSTATIAAAWLGDGTLSVVSSNPSLATVSVSGGTITVTGVAAGGVTISASVSEGSRYAAGSANAGVTVQAAEYLPIPTQRGTLTYNGTTQTPVWNNYDSTKMTVSGNLSGINAGSYSATFTLNAGYAWSDGTSAAKTVAWAIAKANPNISVNPLGLTVKAGESKTVTVTRAGNGAISAQSGDTQIATVSASGTTVTVTGVTEGTTYYTVRVEETTNYSAELGYFSIEITSANLTTATIKNIGVSTVIPITAYSSDSNTGTTIQVNSGAQQANGTFTIPVMIGGSLVVKALADSDPAPVISGCSNIRLIRTAIYYPREGTYIGGGGYSWFFHITGENPTIQVKCFTVY